MVIYIAEYRVYRVHKIGENNYDIVTAMTNKTLNVCTPGTESDWLEQNVRVLTLAIVSM